MARTRRRPTVAKGQARAWLRRFEEHGESPPQIAQSDGYDVRTVRKYVEQALQDRELREARVHVVRQALERHYADLLAFVEVLDGGVKGPTRVPAASTRDPMWRALREHLPKWPVWRLLARWEELFGRLSQLEAEAVSRMESFVNSSRWLALVQSTKETGLYREGLERVTKDRLRGVADAPDAPHDLDAVTLIDQTDGRRHVVYKATICASVPAQRAKSAQTIVLNLLQAIPDWPEASAMTPVLAEFKRVTEALVEEFTILLLRRVVPGKCRYCPF